MKNKDLCTVDVIIPTYKPDKRIYKIIEKLNIQHHKVNKIIIMNTQTEKQYIDDNMISEKYSNVEVYNVPKKEFNHGLTRNLGVSHSQADYIIFMTQDAMPMDKYLIDELIRPFSDEDVYVTYARQLPNKNCKYVEKYIRSFNYPDKDITKNKEDIETMGVKAFFCSDVCAAYSRKHFIELGEFVETDFNEDTYFAYKVLMNDKKVYYASCARVLHSHNYTYREQFKRNYAIGKSQKEFAYVFENVKSESEGIRMVKSAMSHILRHGKWYMIPDLIISSGFKLLGYRMGKAFGTKSSETVNENNE